MPAAAPPHFLQFKDFTRDELAYLFERTRWIKERFKRYELYQPLRDRTLAMVFEKASHAHARVVRGRHEPAGRHRDQPEPRRHAALARRADRGRRARDLAHGRRRDDPHVRADDHRALRRALARAGDQRAHQRVPPVPDPRRHLHVRRASRHRSRAGPSRGSATATTSATRGCRRRRILDFNVHVSTPPGLRSRTRARRRRRPRPLPSRSPTRWTRAAAPTS